MGGLCSCDDKKAADVNELSFRAQYDEGVPAFAGGTALRIEGGKEIIDLTVNLDAGVQRWTKVYNTYVFYVCTCICLYIHIYVVYEPKHTSMYM